VSVLLAAPDKLSGKLWGGRRGGLYALRYADGVAEEWRESVGECGRRAEGRDEANLHIIKGREIMLKKRDGMLEGGGRNVINYASSCEERKIARVGIYICLESTRGDVYTQRDPLRSAECRLVQLRMSTDLSC
jgi:hypothetical protein